MTAHKMLFIDCLLFIKTLHHKPYANNILSSIECLS